MMRPYSYLGVYCTAVCEGVELTSHTVPLFLGRKCGIYDIDEENVFSMLLTGTEGQHEVNQHVTGRAAAPAS